MLPAALLFLITLLWLGWRIIHPYYTVALAPAIGALIGIGAVELWQRRSLLLPRAVLAAGLAGTAAWAFVMLDRAPNWQPWLRVVVLLGGLACALVLALPGSARREAAVALAVLGVTLGLAAPAAYALDTAATAHHGAIPSAGSDGRFRRPWCRFPRSRIPRCQFAGSWRPWSWLLGSCFPRSGTSTSAVVRPPARRRFAGWQLPGRRARRWWEWRPARRHHGQHCRQRVAKP